MIEVAKAKQRVYDDLDVRLDSKEGVIDLYRLVRQRDSDGKDVKETKVIKDGDGNVVTASRSGMRRCKDYFKELMNEENKREQKRRRGDCHQEVAKNSKGKVRRALKRMKSGKIVGADDITVEVWRDGRVFDLDIQHNLRA